MCLYYATEMRVYLVSAIKSTVYLFTLDKPEKEFFELLLLYAKSCAHLIESYIYEGLEVQNECTVANEVGQVYYVCAKIDIKLMSGLFDTG